MFAFPSATSTTVPAIFQDLHTEVSKSWKKTISYCIFSPQISTKNIFILLRLIYGYEAMPRKTGETPTAISPLKRIRLLGTGV